jgi:hypothetical protein
VRARAPRSPRASPQVAVAFKAFLLQEGAELIERLVGSAVPERAIR